MTNAWALSALWALVVTQLAISFRSSTGLPKTAADAIARIIGAQLGIGGLHASKQRNHFFPAQLSHHIGTARQPAIQLRIEALSCRTFLQPAAWRPGKCSHHV